MAAEVRLTLGFGGTVAAQKISFLQYHKSCSNGFRALRECPFGRQWLPRNKISCLGHDYARPDDCLTASLNFFFFFFKVQSSGAGTVGVSRPAGRGGRGSSELMKIISVQTRCPCARAHSESHAPFAGSFGLRWSEKTSAEKATKGHVSLSIFPDFSSSRQAAAAGSRRLQQTSGSSRQAAAAGSRRPAAGSRRPAAGSRGLQQAGGNSRFRRISA